MRVKAEAEVFRKIPLFADADRAHLQVIAFAAERADFSKGQAIISQGVQGAAAYLILSGRAEIFVRENGETRRIGAADAGAFLGELAMIANIPYSVTVIAAEPVNTARIPRSLFMRVVGEFPEFGARVHAALAKKLSTAASEIMGTKSIFDKAGSFSRRPV
jgi:CRP-like cAMP-binding protein